MYIKSYDIYILINVNIKFNYNVFHYDIKERINVVKYRIQGIMLTCFE